MKRFEGILIRSVGVAHKEYIKISGGYWLWHAPEFFIQVVMAQELSNAFYKVYMDIPNKRIREDHPSEGVEFSLDDANRPDLTVWHKSKNLKFSVKAKIEIKKTRLLKDVKNDVDKLRKNIEHGMATKTGYVVVYTEIKEKNHVSKLEKRFKDWATNCKVKLVNFHIDPIIEYDKEKKKKWAWGACILKV